MRELLEEVLQSGKKIKDAEFTFNSLSTGERTFLINVGLLQTPIDDMLILISFEDITRRKKRFKKEKQRLESIRVILDRAPAAICTLRGRDYVVELANEKFFQLMGKKDLIGKTGREAVPEVMDQGYEDILNGVFDTGKAYIGNEMPLTVNIGQEDEKTTYIDFICQPIKDQDNKVTGIFTNAVDVSEKVLARKKIEESEKNLRVILDSVPAIIWITDTNCEATFVNRHWYEYTGMKAGVAGGLDWVQVIHPECREDFRSKFREATLREEAYSATYRLRTKNGDYRWVMDSGRPKYNIEGKYEGLIGTIIDVHEEKVKEQLISEKEHRMRSLVEEATVPMAVFTGPELKIALANEAMKIIWRRPFDPVGFTLPEVLPELEGEAVFSTTSGCFLNG